ncbi:MAG: STN domain-containing protein [Fimbriimonadales bacterium]|nr:STN domain-containing protein [Fimbriimonadales bacterium]
MKKGSLFVAIGVALLVIAWLMVWADPRTRDSRDGEPRTATPTSTYGDVGDWDLACLEAPEPLGSLWLLQSPFSDPAFDRKVSVTFQSARVVDVLKWLEVEGISFVVDPRSFGEERTVSLSVKDQPLRDVLNAIARVLNAHWEREGNIYILKPGRRVTEITLMPERVSELLRKHLGELPRIQLGLEMERELQEKVRELLKKGTVLPEKRVLLFKSGNIGQLMDSLTPEQWALHECRGYLKVEDLTPSQRALLGSLPESAHTWSITVVTNGKKLTLKSG